MGTMSFLLPTRLPPEGARELERACVLGGQDDMPAPAQVEVASGRLFLHRNVEDSGALAVPWQLNGFGRLMVSSGTLIERSSPYHFQVELARGQINHLRCQLAEWQSAGLQVPAELHQSILRATQALSKAIAEPDPATADVLAESALTAYASAADDLVHVYVAQMFQARHQRQARLETLLGCRLGTASELQEPQADALLKASNSICLPIVWSEIEPDEGEFRWEPLDALASWASDQRMSICAGPVIDFSPTHLPPWIKQWRRDVSGFADALCAFVQAVVRRYRGQVRTWILTGGSNSSASPWSLSEDEVLWLTVRLGEAARQVDANASLAVGISEPWGEYLSCADRAHSPFVFADTLVRSGMGVSALELEIVMGVTPRGCYCRDLLETSRLLDLYSLLGVPLRVTLGYPSSSAQDAQADPDLHLGAGHWRDGYTPEIQAEWATRVIELVMCKPVVRAVHWAHVADNNPHLFPNCGLFDAGGEPKPVVEQLRKLRETRL